VDTKVLRFTGSRKRDPMVDAWFHDDPSDLRSIARYWFDAMRKCGDDVRELLHDGHPTACIDDAGFAYVNAFTAHVNVGFFRGAELPDPAGILEGTGRFMRHVKIRRDEPFNEPALLELIRAAHLDMRARIAASEHSRR
jgi:hypothetical protein